MAEHCPFAAQISPVSHPAGSGMLKFRQSPPFVLFARQKESG
jgi:hypothetical protein